MARKRKPTEEPEMPVTAESEPKTKPVRLDLTPEVHRLLRVAAALEGKPMALFARELVEREVRRRAEEREAR